MAEYIERELAKAYFTPAPGVEFIGPVSVTVESLLQTIDNIPAADVRPVTLCRDCMHKGWVQEPEHGKSVDYCRLIERCVDKQFFCAAGERKTNCGADMREES